MPRFSHAINSFNAGELSPHLYGRTDFAKYQSGAETIQNFVVHAEGGVTRRSGSHFVREVIDSTKKSRIFPFVFSTEQAYVLEFGDGVIRVFANEGFVLAPTRVFLDVDVDAAAGASNQIEITDHGYRDGQGPVRLTTTGVLPTGLALATGYYVKTAQTLTATATAAPNQFTIASHGWSGDTDGRPGPFWVYSPNGILPTGGNLTYETDYYLERINANTVELDLARTGGHLAVTWTNGTGNPNWLLVPRPDYVRDKLRFSATSGGAEIDITGLGGGAHTITPTPAFPLEIASPYAEADLYSIHTVQSADVFYIVHPSHPPRKLSRLGNTEWALDEIDLQDGPYGPQNLTATTLTASGANEKRKVITANSTTGINGGLGFQTSDIGRLVWIREDSDTIGWGIILGRTSPLIVEVSVRRTFGATGRAEWRLGSFYPGNYPTSISFFEQRLAFGGESATPQTLHASTTDDFETFSPQQLDTLATTPTYQVLDTTALDFTIGANQVNSIVFLAAGRNLLVGTPGGIYPMHASTNNEAVTPTNVNLPQSTVAGAAMVQARNLENNILYVARGGRKIRSARFDFTVDGYTTDDQTQLADHITRSGIVLLDSAFEPDSILWALRADGILAGLTMVNGQEVVGWHRHILGGTYLGDAAVVESIAVIPSPNEDHDQLWITVKRTINATTNRYVEFLEEEFDAMDVEDQWFVDSGLELDGAGTADPQTVTAATQAPTVVITTSGTHGYAALDRIRITHMKGMTELNAQTWKVAAVPAPTAFTFGVWDLANLPVDGTAFGAYIVGGEVRKETKTISNLGHLEGESVQVLIDGAVHPNRTVASGAIALAEWASEVKVGLGYVSDLQTLRLDIPDATGRSIGHMSRIDHAILRFHETIGGKLGRDADHLDPIVFRESIDPMDLGPRLFSGDKKLVFEGGYTRAARVLVRQDQPLAMTILAMNLLGSEAER